MKAIIQLLTAISVVLCSANYLIAQGIIIQPGAMMTVQDGAKLTTTGTAGITVQSDATGTGSFLDQNTAGGNITFAGTQSVERYLTSGAWHLISAPISEALSGIFVAQYLRPYNEAGNSWGDYIVPLTTPLTPGIGYSCWPVTAQAYTFSGTLNTGTVSPGLAYSGATRGNNLIGNPYPSAIDWNATSGWAKTNIGTTIWFWNQSAMTYDTWNGTTGTHDVTRYIAVGQGFFVQTIGSSPSISMTNEVRVHNSQPFLKNSDLPNALRLQAKNAYGSDEIVVYFDPSSSWIYDPMIDSRKMFSDGIAPQIYSFKPGDPEELSISVLPEITNPLVIPVGLNIGKKGNYRITASQMESFAPNVSLYLEDLKLGTAINLRVEPVYMFQGDTSDAHHRFNLHFSNWPYGVQDQQPDHKIRIYSFEKSIYVKNDSGISLEGHLLIYDALGRCLVQYKLNGSEINRFSPDLIRGYYIVKVLANSTVHTQKVFIN